jgi:hypothetical protein
MEVDLTKQLQGNVLRSKSVAWAHMANLHHLFSQEHLHAFSEYGIEDL